MNITNSESHSLMTIDEIVDFVVNYKSLGIIARNLKFMQARIIELTGFLDAAYANTKHTKTGSLAFKDRLFFLKNGVKTHEDIPKCVHCDSVALYDANRNLFRDFCSNKSCSKLVIGTKVSEKFQDVDLIQNAKAKRKKTNLERYGTVTPAQNRDVVEKTKKTNLERYGCESPSSHPTIREKVKKTNLERYGVECTLSSDVVKEKIKKTNLERYGVEYASQSSEIRMKVKNTMIERYGVEHIMQSQEIRDKMVEKSMETYGVPYPQQTDEYKNRISQLVKVRLSNNPDELERRKETNRERYGHENPFGGDVIKAKIKSVLLERYGVEHIMQSQEIRDKMVEKSMEKYGCSHPTQAHISKETMDILNDPQQLKELYDAYGSLQLGHMLGVWDGTVTTHLRRHNLEVNPTTQSAVERRLAAFIESHGVEIIQNDRTVLNGKELDIYIPSLNLAFEMNGVYWHCTKFKPKRHLLEKQKACDEAGIRLVHIFDDEYNQREEQFNRKIKRLIGVADGEKRVYARKTEARIIDNKVAKPFYDTNHIQGNGFGSIAYGLYHGDELVACMSFKTNFGYMELTRYATSCNVIGGFTKLVKAFMRDNQDIDRLVSFADCRYSDAGMYEKNGWVQIGKTKPSYWYVINGVRVPKQKFRRKYLPAFLGDGFVEEQSETENMENNGYYRIFDCGLKKFELTRK